MAQDVKHPKALQYIKENNLDQKTIQTVIDFINTKHNNQVCGDQKITLQEVLFAFKMCKHTQRFPLFLPKVDTKFAHSILLYKENDNYHILIKPNLQIKNLSYLKDFVNNKSVACGSNKIVKMTGLEIRLDANKSLLKVQPVVTVSRTPKDNQKGEGLIPRSKNLTADNFRRIEYSITQNDEIKPRVLFVKDNLGTNLKLLLSDEQNFNMAARLKVIEQLCEKISSKTGDVKLENVCWNGEIASFIDDKDLVFTYTTKNDSVGTTGYAGVNLTEEQIEKQQIFGLALICYQLLTNHGNVIYGTGHDHKKPESLVLKLGMDNKFAALVEGAYLGNVPDLETCVGFIQDILQEY